MRTKYARNTHGPDVPAGLARGMGADGGRGSGSDGASGAATHQLQDLLVASVKLPSLDWDVRKALAGRVLRTKYARRSGAVESPAEAGRAYFVRTFCALRIVRCGHPNR